MLVWYIYNFSFDGLRPDTIWSLDIHYLVYWFDRLLWIHINLKDLVLHFLVNLLNCLPITIIPPLFASAYISLFNFISFCSTTSLSFTWNTRNNLALIGIPLVENTLQISWKSDWACSVIHRGEKLYNIVYWSVLLKLFLWTFTSTTLLTLFKIDDKVNTMIFKMVGKCKVLWLNFC